MKIISKRQNNGVEKKERESRWMKCTKLVRIIKYLRTIFTSDDSIDFGKCKRQNIYIKYFL